MKVTKIKIKNLFGISEYEGDSKSVELIGTNGAGKTSVIDAIKYALTNRSNRDYIIKSTENEGEIIIETDTGLTINRRARANQADYKSIKENGKEVQSPESFLKTIFTDLQLNPVEFLQMDKKEQNRIILDMINFDWDLNWIKSQFGEIPQGVNYEQNILQVLNDIQAENGVYFQTRQDVNRDIRNKNAIIEDIANELPTDYNATKWETVNLGDLFKEVEKAQRHNAEIDKAKQIIDNSANKIRKFEADKEIEIAAIDREINGKREQLEKENARLQEQINANNAVLAGLAGTRADKVNLAEQTYKANVAEYAAEVEKCKDIADKDKINVEPLADAANQAEKMKNHLNEYRRMVTMQNAVESLKNQSQALTDKIELARQLPAMILEKSEIPIKGITIKDGVPLFNGLPISNLSEGEKLDLCIDVTIQKPNALQIILIDGVERLSEKNRFRLYEKCKSKGLQLIATRTDDSEDLTVIEL